jgi:hypothetical protein
MTAVQMAEPKRKISENEVSQKINLKVALGQLSNVPEIREAFFQAVVDKMVERTELSRDINGKIFDKYSKSYKNSLAFNVFGKTNKVNMTLTGDMLGSIDKIDESRDTMTVGITGDENIIKAFAHITGFKGHPTLDGKVKPRDFFGITEKEIETITKDFEPETDSGSAINDSVLIEKIINLLGGQNGE